MSNLPFSHGVFKRLVLRTGLFGKGLKQEYPVNPKPAVRDREFSFRRM